MVTSNGYIMLQRVWSDIKRKYEDLRNEMSSTAAAAAGGGEPITRRQIVNAAMIAAQSAAADPGSDMPYFKVKRISGELKLGADPELSSEDQMLVDLRFWSKAEILELPKNQFHSRIFNYF
jgi:hypothetical protein